MHDSSRISKSARATRSARIPSPPRRSSASPQPSIRSPSTSTRRPAKKSHFGGLLASGWHTQAVWMKLNVRHWQRQRSAREAAGLPSARVGPSPGFDELKWLKPVYAGDTITFVNRSGRQEAQPLDARLGPRHFQDDRPQPVGRGRDLLRRPRLRREPRQAGTRRQMSATRRDGAPLRNGRAYCAGGPFQAGSASIFSLRRSSGDFL